MSAPKPAPSKDVATTDAPAPHKYAGKFRVLTTALTVWSNKEKKSGDRHMRGAIIALDPELHDTEKLLALRAIEPADTDESKGLTNPRQLVMAANAFGQETGVTPDPETQPMTPEDAKTQGVETS